MKLIFKTLIRVIGMNITVGGLMEYYWVNVQDGRKELVAFQQPMLKGNVYRVMWFYQKTKYKKSSIWFHALKYAVDYVLDDASLRFIDLGPSYNEAVKEMKSKFGFQHLALWREHCDYSGDLRTVLV